MYKKGRYSKGMELWKIVIYVFVAFGAIREKSIGMKRLRELMVMYGVKVGGYFDGSLGVIGNLICNDISSNVGFGNGRIPLTRDRFKFVGEKSIYSEVCSKEYEGIFVEVIVGVIGLLLGLVVKEKWKVSTKCDEEDEVEFSIGEVLCESGSSCGGIKIYTKRNSRVLKFIREMMNYSSHKYPRRGYIDSELFPLHMMISKILSDDESLWIKFFNYSKKMVEGNKKIMDLSFNIDSGIFSGSSCSGCSWIDISNDRSKEEISILFKFYSDSGFKVEELNDMNLCSVIFMGLDNIEGRKNVSELICKYVQKSEIIGKEEGLNILKNIIEEASFSGNGDSSEVSSLLETVSSYSVLNGIPFSIGLCGIEKEIEIYSRVGKGICGDYLVSGFGIGLCNSWNCGNDDSRMEVKKKGFSVLQRLIEICSCDDIYDMLRREQIRIGVIDSAWKDRYESNKMISEMMNEVRSKMKEEIGSSRKLNMKFVQKEKLNFTIVRNNGIKLAHRIYKEGFIPDIIYVILRGGGYIGNYVSEYFNGVCKRKVPYGAVATQCYLGVAQAGSVKVCGWIYPPSSLNGSEKVLLIDDIFDSGRTINHVVGLILKEGGIQRENLRIVVHDYKYCADKKEQCEYKPDYWCRMQDVSVRDSIPRWISYGTYRLIGLSSSEVEEEYYKDDAELREALSELMK
jgi:hypoxanthine phosphoribosyltransferase